MTDKNEINKKHYIAIEGPIGVGKTTLARKIAQTNQSELLLEKIHENPFLERFYQNPKTGALPAQLQFLFNRTQQLKSLVQTDMFINAYVADFLIEKDQLFAEVTLNQEELNLYQQVYQNLTFDAPKPDLVIYLQAPVNVLHKRIKNRGVSMESAITTEYLEKLSSAYTDFFHYYESAPLLIVNASGIDLVNNDEHFQQLMERIENTTNGRNYFNPTIS